MLYTLARLLQFAGLIILPIAITGNVADRLDLRQSLMWSTAGGLVFVTGWLLQQAAKPK